MYMLGYTQYMTVIRRCTELPKFFFSTLFFHFWLHHTLYCHGRYLSTCSNMIKKVINCAQLGCHSFAHTRIYWDIRLWEMRFSYIEIYHIYLEITAFQLRFTAGRTWAQAGCEEVLFLSAWLRGCRSTAALGTAVLTVLPVLHAVSHDPLGPPAGRWELLLPPRWAGRGTNLKSNTVQAIVLEAPTPTIHGGPCKGPQRAAVRPRSFKLARPNERFSTHRDTLPIRVLHTPTTEQHPTMFSLLTSISNHPHSIITTVIQPLQPVQPHHDVQPHQPRQPSACPAPPACSSGAGRLVGLDRLRRLAHYVPSKNAVGGLKWS